MIWEKTIFWSLWELCSVTMWSNFGHHF